MAASTPYRPDLRHLSLNVGSATKAGEGAPAAAVTMLSSSGPSSFLELGVGATRPSGARNPNRWPNGNRRMPFQRVIGLAV